MVVRLLRLRPGYFPDPMKNPADSPVKGTTNTAEVVSMLAAPRKDRCCCWCFTGKAVDSRHRTAAPASDKGDLIIDGGNSHFEDTNRRTEYMR